MLVCVCCWGRGTSLAIPESVTSLDSCEFAYCANLTSVTLTHGLVDVDQLSFVHCNALVSVVIRPTVSRGAFIAWSVGSSRNRANWQLTTVHRLRNILRLITEFAMWSRDVTALTLSVFGGDGNW